MQDFDIINWAYNVEFMWIQCYFGEHDMGMTFGFRFVCSVDSIKSDI